MLVTNKFQDLACGLLAWNQYSLLAAPRHLINPRFHLTSPLVSGLFYISPGAGFLLGAIAGGRFSDMTMANKIKERGGIRVPQDRLNSGLLAFFFIIPASQLIYGWCLQYDVGGLALAIVAAFFTGFGLMAAFSSLNTYCAGKSSTHLKALSLESSTNELCRSHTRTAHCSHCIQVFYPVHLWRVR